MSTAPRKADPEYVRLLRCYLDQGLSPEQARKRAARELHEIRHGDAVLTAWLRPTPTGGKRQ